MAQDAYYWDKGHLTPEEKKKINFDHPDSIEWDLLVGHLDQLRSGKSIEMPIYTYVTCARSNETITVKPRSVIIVEGILLLTQEALRRRFSVKVFVDAESDDRLSRIMERDLLERGRNVADVLAHYHSYVKPMHFQFIEPSKRYADIIVPQGGENEIAIDILASKIMTYL